MIKRVAFLLIILISTFALRAQEEEKADLLNKFIPDYAKLHYAGGIGFLSAGAGYELFKKRNAEVDFFFGYLPESIGGDDIYTIAAKFHYMPWKFSIGSKEQYSFEPLTIGAMAFHAMNSHLNKASSREIYPDKYYQWIVSTRFGPFIGSRITKKLDENNLFKTITFYYEIGTNDLYLYSWTSNPESVPFSKLWNTSFGLKIGF